MQMPKTASLHLGSASILPSQRGSLTRHIQNTRTYLTGSGHSRHPCTTRWQHIRIFISTAFLCSMKTEYDFPAYCQHHTPACISNCAGLATFCTNTKLTVCPSFLSWSYFLTFCPVYLNQRQLTQFLVLLRLTSRSVSALFHPVTSSGVLYKQLYD